MPKIATHEFSVDAKGLRKAFKVDVMYSQKDGFHVVIKDEQILTLVKALAETEMKAQKIEKRIKGYSFQKNYREDFIICGTDIDQTKQKVAEVFKALLTQTVTTRDVIMIKTERSNTGSREDYSYNHQHTPLSVSFGLVYATEVSTGNGKIYRNKRNNYEIGRRAYDLRDWTVIDDTPEARKTLETLYDAAKAVFDKLKLFTSPDKIEELLSNGGNFLPSPKLEEHEK